MSFQFLPPAMLADYASCVEFEHPGIQIGATLPGVQPAVLLEQVDSVSMFLGALHALEWGDIDLQLATTNFNDFFSHANTAILTAADGQGQPAQDFAKLVDLSAFLQGASFAEFDTANLSVSIEVAKTHRCPAVGRSLLVAAEIKRVWLRRLAVACWMSVRVTPWKFSGLSPSELELLLSFGVRPDAQMLEDPPSAPELMSGDPAATGMSHGFWERTATFAHPFATATARYHTGWLWDMKPLALVVPSVMALARAQTFQPQATLTRHDALTGVVALLAGSAVSKLPIAAATKPGAPYWPKFCGAEAFFGPPDTIRPAAWIPQFGDEFETCTGRVDQYLNSATHGDCKYFSAVILALLRTLGVPARIGCSRIAECYSTPGSAVPAYSNIVKAREAVAKGQRLVPSETSFELAVRRSYLSWTGGYVTASASGMGVGPDALPLGIAQPPHTLRDFYSVPAMSSETGRLGESWKDTNAQTVAAEAPSVCSAHWWAIAHVGWSSWARLTASLTQTAPVRGIPHCNLAAQPGFALTGATAAAGLYWRDLPEFAASVALSRVVTKFRRVPDVWKAPGKSNKAPAFNELVSAPKETTFGYAENAGTKSTPVFPGKAFMALATSSATFEANQQWKLFQIFCSATFNPQAPSPSKDYAAILLLPFGDMLWQLIDPAKYPSGAMSPDWLDAVLGSKDMQYVATHFFAQARVPEIWSRVDPIRPWDLPAMNVKEAVKDGIAGSFPSLFTNPYFAGAENAVALSVTEHKNPMEIWAYSSLDVMKLLLVLFYTLRNYCLASPAPFLQQAAQKWS